MPGFNFTRFAATSVLSSSTLDANLALVEAQLGSIRNADIAGTSNISSNKLADKYTVAMLTLVLTPNTWGTSAGVKFQDQASRGSGLNARFYPLYNGRLCYFVGIKGYVTGYTASSGGNHGVIWININGHPFSAINISASGAFSLGGDFSNPIMPVGPDDTIAVALGKQSDTDADYPDATAITITLGFKIELTE